MKYILDSDTIIYYLKGMPKVIQHLENVSLDLLNTSIITHAELHFGALNSTHKKRNLDVIQAFLSKIPIIPFCEKASQVFAEHKALLKKNGTIIADMDLMIASICLHNQMTLVTNNIKHFARINKLKIENWA